MNDVRACADAQGLLNIVIGDEDRDSLLSQAADFGLQFFDCVRIDGSENIRILSNSINAPLIQYPGLRKAHRAGSNEDG